MALGSKKGNVALDTLFFLIVIFVIGVVAVVLQPSLNEINADLQQDDFLSAENKASVNESVERYDSIMDSTILIFFSLFWVLVLISSFLIDTHPIFLPITLILFIIVVFVAISINNVWIEMMDEPQFEGYEADFPITAFIFDNIIKFVVAVGLSIGVVLYGKNRFL
jgi:hypothetical protein